MATMYLIALNKNPTLQHTRLDGVLMAKIIRIMKKISRKISQNVTNNTRETKSTLDLINQMRIEKCIEIIKGSE